jgi:hypothetical protein
MHFKDNPREWRKFTWLYSFVAVLLCWLAWRRHKMPTLVLEIVVFAAVSCALLAFFIPSFIAPLYRLTMRTSSRLSHAAGKVLLTLLYMFGLIPTSLILRLTGKKLLDVHPDKKLETYWNPPRKTGGFEQQF